MKKNILIAMKHVLSISGGQEGGVKSCLNILKSVALELGGSAPCHSTF